MSLEQAVAANTAAIEKLTAAWEKLAALGAKAADSAAAGKGVNAGGKPIVKGAETGTSGASTASSKPANESQQTGDAGAGVGGITAEDVSKLVVSAAAKLGRPKTLELLAPFGATSGKTVKPEHYEAVAQVLKEALAAAEGME